MKKLFTGLMITALAPVGVFLTPLGSLADYTTGLDNPSHPEISQPSTGSSTIQVLIEMTGAKRKQLSELRAVHADRKKKLSVQRSSISEQRVKAISHLDRYEKLLSGLIKQQKVHKHELNETLVHVESVQKSVNSVANELSKLESRISLTSSLVQILGESAAYREVWLEAISRIESDPALSVVQKEALAVLRNQLLDAPDRSKVPEEILDLFERTISSFDGATKGSFVENLQAGIAALIATLRVQATLCESLLDSMVALERSQLEIRNKIK